MLVTCLHARYHLRPGHEKAARDSQAAAAATACASSVSKRESMARRPRQMATAVAANASCSSGPCLPEAVLEHKSPTDSTARRARKIATAITAVSTTTNPSLVFQKLPWSINQCLHNVRTPVPSLSTPAVALPFLPEPVLEHKSILAQCEKAITCPIGVPMKAVALTLVC